MNATETLAPPPVRLRAFLRRSPTLASGLAVLVGATVGIGWWFDVPRLTCAISGEPMAAATAVMSLLAGTALWLAARARLAPAARLAAKACASLVCAIAALTLFESAAALDLGLDHVLAAGSLDAVTGRPSPQTALAFLLLGTALLLIDRRSARGHRIADYLALAAAAIALLGMLGYLFGVPAMYGLPARLPVIGMSVPAAFVLFALAGGIIAARLDEGAAAVVLRRDPGGVAGRHLLLGLVLFPPQAIALVLAARAGWYTLPVASSLVLFLAIAECTGFILVTANRLSRVDAATRRVSEALRASEERVRTLVEHASDAIFVADLEGRYTEVNDAACRLLGYPRHVLIGKTIADLIGPDEVPRLAAEHARMVASGDVTVSEWSLQRADGTRVPVEVSAKVFADGRWQASVRDITERRRTEAALAQVTETERQLRAEVEALATASTAVSEAVADLPHSDLDAVLRVIAAQARALTDAEYAAVAIGTDPERPFDHWEVDGVAPDVATKIGRRPRPVGLLGHASERDGALRLADLHQHPAYRGFPTGHPDMTSLLMVPIRHRKRAVGYLYLANKRAAPEFSEHDTRKVTLLANRVGAAIETASLYAREATQRAWVQSILDQLPEGVLVLDAQGEVKAMNHAIVALAAGESTGPDPWGNPSVFDVRDAEGRPLPFDELPIVRALRTGEATRDRALQVRQRDGRMIPISASSVALRDGEGAISGAAVVVRDISDQRERERLREEWIAVVAHDLRQPVNTILLSTARLLGLCSGDGSVDKAPAVLERIRGASWRLNRMIEDLLDAARIEANRLTIEHRAVDLVELVEVEIDNTRLAHPGAQLRLDAHPHQLAWIDPDRVHQVLANLISNAVKYGTPGAEIVIAVRGDEATTQVTVTNAGPGIPPAELATLFARFTRTREARSGPQPGIGLGLYICKGLIEAQGGRMWAESEPGRTSFHFTVPKPVGA